MADAIRTRLVNNRTRSKPKKGRKAGSRKTGSRKTGCEFKLTITRTPDNKWVVEVLNDTHNHELPRHRSASSTTTSQNAQRVVHARMTCLQSVYHRRGREMEALALLE